MELRHTLLIDDNDVDNYISKHVISSSNMAEKITVMYSAVEALEYLSALLAKSEAFPDTIFLDIMMPVMDGFDFLDEYSKFPEHVIQKPLIYMLSSSTDKKDMERASKIPFVKKYLSKPLNLGKLQDL